MTVSGEPCPNPRCGQDHEADIIDTYLQGGHVKALKLRCPERDCEAVWIMDIW